MLKIAHIVNPFIADKSSDLFLAQPFTFQSMINAKKVAESEVEVELLTAQFEEDQVMVPSGFRATRNLERSVLDIHEFKTPRKLPLIADILQRLYNESEAEYLIYTNVDIGLFPDFYLKVKKFIETPLDSLIINRRRIPSKYKELIELEQIYCEKGFKHPGFDCFVFHRDLFPKFVLENICIGVPFIEIAFSQNLFAHSTHFKLYDSERLTFHIGMEVFRKRAPLEYYDFNRSQFWDLVPALWNKMDLEKFPYSQLFWPYRLIKWGLHPCIPIFLVLKLEIRNFKRKLGIAT